VVRYDYSNHLETESLESTVQLKERLVSTLRSLTVLLVRSFNRITEQASICIIITVHKR